MATRELLVTPYLTLTFDAERRIVRYSRTSTPLPLSEEAGPMLQAVAEAVEPLDGHRVGLLVDLREAPGRNDKEFETRMTKWRDAFFARFEHSAVLVKTAAGKLQVMRLSAGSERRSTVFTDEAEAFRYLADHLAQQGQPKLAKAAR